MFCEVTGSNEKSRGTALKYARPLIIVLVWLVVYHDVIRRLIGDWLVDQNYSHGFLVPIVSAYAFVSMRERLKAEPPDPRPVPGLIFMLVAALLLFAGQLSAELFLTRISLVLSIFALIVYFAGWRRCRMSLFPVGLLLLAIPLPEIIFNRIAFPLQLIASDLATRMIRWFGVPALREGNVIELARMKLQVIEACSGIRSLIALTTLSAIFVYFTESGPWRRIILFLLVVPIAVLSNALRVAGTGILAHYRGTAAAEGFLHGFAGWSVFLVEVVLLLGIYGAITFALRSAKLSGGRA